MSGKELIYQVLRHEDTPRVPWVPFAGIHAGALKGYRPTEVLTNSQKHYEALMEVVRLYQPDGLPVVFETMWRLKREIGDSVALYGLICGPLTLASHLRGSGFFMDLVKKKDYAKALVDWCADVAITMADFYIDAGADVVASVDPLISQISPKHFEAYCAPAYQKLFDHIRARGVFSSFFVCGNAIKNIEGMCSVGPDCISVDENINLAQAKEISDRHNVAIACSQAVHNTPAARTLVADYQRSDDLDAIEVDLPDYAALTKPLVELFALDPMACAACTYMLAVWEEARAALGEGADWGDYRYNRREDIARMRKLGVANLPSMYINGKLRYDSIIPSKEDLVREIQASAP